MEGLDMEKLLERIDEMGDEVARDVHTCWYVSTHDMKGGIVSTDRVQAELLARQIWGDANWDGTLRECVIVGPCRG